jgi:hypothetical protein
MTESLVFKVFIKYKHTYMASGVSQGPHIQRSMWDVLWYYNNDICSHKNLCNVIPLQLRLCLLILANNGRKCKGITFTYSC